jgi:hypothetical protein
VLDGETLVRWAAFGASCPELGALFTRHGAIDFVARELTVPTVAGIAAHRVWDAARAVLVSRTVHHARNGIGLDVLAMSGIRAVSTDRLRALGTAVGLCAGVLRVGLLSGVKLLNRHRLRWICEHVANATESRPDPLAALIDARVRIARRRLRQRLLVVTRGRRAIVGFFGTRRTERTGNDQNRHR